MGLWARRAAGDASIKGAREEEQRVKWGYTVPWRMPVLQHLPGVEGHAIHAWRHPEN